MNPPLFLWTSTTPNGWRATVFLEELKAAYPGVVEYEYRGLKMEMKPEGTNEQKEEWYLKINPNGRIPALLDRTRPGVGEHGKEGFIVIETSAILLYLERYFDKEKKYGFDVATHPIEYSEVEQWMMFVHGGCAPVQGQVWTLSFMDKDKHADAIKYYVGESKRLFCVLEKRLEGRDYLVGEGKGKYTIADINAFPWASAGAWTGIPTLDEWPNLKAWVERVAARPAVKVGLKTPPPAW